MKKSLILLIFFAIFACSSDDKQKEEQSILKKKRVNPNAEARAREFADKNPIFNKNKKNTNSTYDFGTSNPLWRATLKTLDFIPLNNVDYAGGVIISDWYGNEGENSTQIKIKIQFLSDQLSVSSIEINGHKKICAQNKCSIQKTDENFNQSLKQKIFENARKISLSDESKK